MKATHNSATGERPANLWAKLFPFVAKCQTKTIRQQDIEGVRLFDIRVRYDRQGRLVCCHGLAVYDKTLKDVVIDLCHNIDLYERPDVWLMVTYEGELDDDRHEDFIADVSDCVKGYEGIHLGHISVKEPVWDIISPNPKQPSYVSNYTKIVGLRCLLPFPRLWWWLRQRHKPNETNESNEALSMEDFV